MADGDSKLGQGMESIRRKFNRGEDPLGQGYTQTAIEPDETPANKAAKMQRMQNKAEEAKKKYMEENNVDENMSPVKSTSPGIRKSQN